MLNKVIQKGVKVIVIMIIVLSMIIAYSNTMISNAAESDLTLTPKPETNNIHLKWTGPQNSSYKVYQKKPGASSFETIGLTDFNNTDEEVKVLNVYPVKESERPDVLPLDPSWGIPNISVTYDNRTNREYT